MWKEQYDDRNEKWNEMSEKIKGALILDFIVYDTDYSINIVQKLQKNDEEFYILINSNFTFKDDEDNGRSKKIREISEGLYNDYKNDKLKKQTII